MGVAVPRWSAGGYQKPRKNRLVAVGCRTAAPALLAFADIVPKRIGSGLAAVEDSTCWDAAETKGRPGMAEEIDSVRVSVGRDHTGTTAPSFFASTQVTHRSIELHGLLLLLWRLLLLLLLLL